MTVGTQLTPQKPDALGARPSARRGRARTSRSAAAGDALRRCLVTGELKKRADLIRFVIGPGNAVTPDLAEKLPGKGLWVSATKESIHMAAAKNLFAKAAKAAALPALSLADDVIRLLRARCLNLLGLAKGAGIAVVGEAQTEQALRAGRLALYVHAQDARHVLENGQDIAGCGLFTRDELGAALGYDHIVHAGLLAHGLSEKLALELGRLQSMMRGKNEG